MKEEKGEPILTREDVLKLIKENGGTAEKLDLSGKVFEEGIDLRKLDLGGIILKEATLREAHFDGVNLSFANLEGVNLFRAHLEEAELRFTNLEGANLQEVYFEGAELWFAHLDDADLCYAHLERADLWFGNLERVKLSGAILDNDTNLVDARWGNYILGEENKFEFGFAINIYRRLKQWHTNAGMYDTAGEFFFREMTVRRKMLNWWPNPLPRAWSKFLSILCGYGEKWHRVIISAAVVILGLAVAYYFWGSFSSASFWDTLYYSAVSFTALGYGRWAPQPVGWAKGMGAAEAFIGVFTMALFLITFVRKMTR